MIMASDKMALPEELAKRSGFDSFGLTMYIAGLTT